MSKEIPTSGIEVSVFSSLSQENQKIFADCKLLLGDNNIAKIYNGERIVSSDVRKEEFKEILNDLSNKTSEYHSFIAEISEQVEAEKYFQWCVATKKHLDQSKTWFNWQTHVDEIHRNDLSELHSEWCFHSPFSILSNEALYQIVNTILPNLNYLLEEAEYEKLTKSHKASKEDQESLDNFIAELREYLKTLNINLEMAMSKRLEVYDKDPNFHGDSIQHFVGKLQELNLIDKKNIMINPNPAVDPKHIHLFKNFIENNHPERFQYLCKNLLCFQETGNFASVTYQKQNILVPKKLTAHIPDVGKDFISKFELQITGGLDIGKALLTDQDLIIKLRLLQQREISTFQTPKRFESYINKSLQLLQEVNDVKKRFAPQPKQNFLKRIWKKITGDNNRMKVFKFWQEQENFITKNVLKLVQNQVKFSEEACQAQKQADSPEQLNCVDINLLQRIKDVGKDLENKQLMAKLSELQEQAENLKLKIETYHTQKAIDEVFDVLHLGKQYNLKQITLLNKYLEEHANSADYEGIKLKASRVLPVVLNNYQKKLEFFLNSNGAKNQNDAEILQQSGKFLTQMCADDSELKINMQAETKKLYRIYLWKVLNKKDAWLNELEQMIITHSERLGQTDIHDIVEQSRKLRETQAPTLYKFVESYYKDEVKQDFPKEMIEYRNYLENEIDRVKQQCMKKIEGELKNNKNSIQKIMEIIYKAKAQKTMEFAKVMSPEDQRLIQKHTNLLTPMKVFLKLDLKSDELLTMSSQQLEGLPKEVESLAGKLSQGSLADVFKSKFFGSGSMACQPKVLTKDDFLARPPSVISI